MKKLLLALALFLSTSLLSSLSWAADPPIYVVEVEGEGLDGDRVRRALEPELSIVAVTPDDPRAEQAEGRITLDARSADRKITVSFRKTSRATTRTVDAPTDPALAEKTAVLLAGNVARDEAAEGRAERAAPQPAPAPAPAPATAPAPAEAARERLAADQLARLREVAAYQGSLSRTRKWVVGGVETGVGVAFLSAGIAAAASNAPSSSDRDYVILSIAGGLNVGVGGLIMAGVFSPSEHFSDFVDARIASGRSRVDVLATVESEWRKRAKSERSLRQVLGGIFLAAGAVSTATAMAELLKQKGTEDQRFAALGAGLTSASEGLLFLLWEWPLEAAYQTYVRATPDKLQIRPTGSVAPVTGGGAVATFGVVF